VAEDTRDPGAAVLESHEVGAARPKPHPFPDRAAKHWLLSSIVWLTVVDLFGLVLATEFVSPEAFGGISWLTFSRIRPSHVNGVILA
jgi:cbb3-type cytochrome oxidase subunit 1